MRADVAGLCLGEPTTKRPFPHKAHLLQFALDLPQPFDDGGASVTHGKSPREAGEEPQRVLQCQRFDLRQQAWPIQIGVMCEHPRQRPQHPGRYVVGSQGLKHHDDRVDATSVGQIPESWISEIPECHAKVGGCPLVTLPCQNDRRRERGDQTIGHGPPALLHERHIGLRQTPTASRLGLCQPEVHPKRAQSPPSHSAILQL